MEGLLHEYPYYGSLNAAIQFIDENSAANFKFFASKKHTRYAHIKKQIILNYVCFLSLLFLIPSPPTITHLIMKTIIIILITFCFIDLGPAFRKQIQNSFFKLYKYL